MGEEFTQDDWPEPDTAHRRLLEFLDKVHRDNGTKSQRVVSAGAHLVVAQVNAIVRGHRLPDDDGQQIRNLIRGLGGGEDEQRKGVKLFLAAKAEPGAAPRKRSNAVAVVGTSAKLTRYAHPAAFPIAYVQRDIEAEIAAILRERQPVLLIGSPMVGKTTVAAAVIEAEFAGRAAHCPRDPRELRDLAASRPRNGVVFLDDIERLIDATGAIQDAIHTLSANNVLLATIRSRIYGDLQLPTSGVRTPEWDVLCAFKPLVFTGELSSAEQARLCAAVPDDVARQRILDTGIGEYVGAAGPIKTRLELAPRDQPAAMALIRGAADWARAGMRGPVPVDLLPDLAVPHLGRRGRALLRGTGFVDALTWATKDINPLIALLEPVDDGFTVNAYALDLLERDAEPIADTSWRAALDAADCLALLDIADSAVRARRLDVADDALASCEQRQDPDTWPTAAVIRGMRCEALEDFAGAQAAYERAAGSGHRTAAPIAWTNLGYLHRRTGRLDEAKRPFLEAVRLNHPIALMRALVGLGHTFDELGRSDKAEFAYRKAIGLDPDFEEIKRQALRTMPDLGAGVELVIIDARGYPPPPELTASALINLARILVKRGEFGEARRLLERATRSKHPAASAQAWVDLGSLLARSHELPAAQEAYLQALELVDGATVAEVEVNLGAVLLLRKDYDRAESVLRHAMLAHHPEASVAGGVYLVVAKIRRKRMQEAAETTAEVVAIADTPAGRDMLVTMSRYTDEQAEFELAPEVARTVLGMLDGESES